MNTDEHAETPDTTQPENQPEAVAGPKVVVMMDSADADPKYALDGPSVQSIFHAWRLAWHPAVLTHCVSLPSPVAGTFYVVPGRLLSQVPSSFLAQAEDTGAAVIVASDDLESSRSEFLRRLRGHELADAFEAQADLVADFQALGTARLWLASMSTALGHVDVINHDELTRETLAAASGWKSADFNAAASHLRAAFDVLLRARERFYPVDSYLLDMVMTHPRIAPADYRACLAVASPKTFVGPAESLQKLADAGADDVIAQVRTGVDAGWLDMAGGPWDESPEHLLPLETVRTLYRKGDAIYRKHLDDRSVETLFHRNFALYPALPHLARRMGFRFGMPAAFEGGTFPLRRESKMLWASPDGTTLEALTRIPADADDALMPLRFPWLLGQSMKDDHVALAAWLRWPAAGPDWLAVLNTIAGYAPIFGKQVTAGDFFAQTDRPFDTMTPDVDAFADPSLENALSRDEADPVSRLRPEFQARGHYDALSWTHALAKALGLAVPDDAVEQLLGPEFPDSARTAQAAAMAREIGEKIAGVVMAQAPAGMPGTLVFNPCGVARRVPLVLDAAAPDLRIGPSVQAAQFLAEGTLAVVDLPANGFAWVPHFANVDDALTPMGQLRFDFDASQIIHPHFLITIDRKTGGFKGLKRPGEPQARFGQQLGLVGVSGGDEAFCMIAEGEPDVTYGGPAKLEVRTRGRVVDPADEQRTVARFEQVYEAYLGRPTLDLTIEISELDESFFSATHASYSGWGRGLVSRWAWRDTAARLRRLAHLQAHATTADKPTTPEALEVSQGPNRVTIIPHGLPYHRRNGQRMADTLLVAGRESARQFKFSIVMDLEFPHQAAVDSYTPVVAVPVKSGPPVVGHKGWFFHLDHRNVAMTKLEYQPAGTEGRGASMVFHIHETAGRAARTRLRCFFTPSFAKQVDDRDQTILDLSVSDDAIDIDLTPYEIARVEVGL